MSKRAKYIVVGLLVAVLAVAGTIGGVALAQTGTGTASATSGKTLLGRVATILGIDQTKLENAFTQAQKDIRNENLDNYLKGLVAQGKMTQAQADQYKQWYQSQPDATQYQQQMRAWRQARPDVPLPGPAGPGVPRGGRGFQGGMMGRGGTMGGGMMGGWGR